MIFSRRIINRLLNENSKFLPDKVIREHVNKLNTLDKDYLAGEWEVVIINALSKIGTVKYEENFGGNRKPDIYFEPKRIGAFLSDITVVSDKGYHEDNPVGYFHEEFFRYIRKNQIIGNRIHIEFGSEIKGEYGDQKVKISLPSKKEIPRFIKDKFRGFVDLIKIDPSKKQSIVIPVEGSSVKVLYNPSQEFSIIHHLTYNLPMSLERNPIYKSIKDKTDQLKKSGYKGVRGIFLCDGDCEALKMESRGINNHMVRDIIEKVFRNHSTLSFIITLAVKEKYQAFNIHHDKYIEFNLYRNRRAEYPTGPNFANELNAIIKILPHPEVTPANALNDVVFKQKFKGDKEHRRFEGRSFLGGGSMTHNKIKISSQMLTDMLAGLVNYKELEDKGVFGKRNDNWIKDFFLRKRSEGRMIEEVSIEKCPMKDDDWIIIQYGQCDPAINKYTIGKSKIES